MKNAENRKQLDLNDRITIETGIYLKESFTSLAKKLHVHPSTISREVQSNRTFVKGYEPNGNDCRFASKCHRFDICINGGRCNGVRSIPILHILAVIITRCHLPASQHRGIEILILKYGIAGIQMPQ